MPRPLRVVESVLELVGDTPLVRISKLGNEAPRADVWAKMEEANPAGSVKDRICLAMIELAERTGELQPGGVIVEPTAPTEIASASEVVTPQFAPESPSHLDLTTPTNGAHAPATEPTPVEPGLPTEPVQHG